MQHNITPYQYNVSHTFYPIQFSNFVYFVKKVISSIKSENEKTAVGKPQSNAVVIEFPFLIYKNPKFKHFFKKKR